ncbi:MAG: hypothetical protein AAGA55_03215 [Planctomycetota bacterium]
MGNQDDPLGVLDAALADYTDALRACSDPDLLPPVTAYADAFGPPRIAIAFGSSPGFSTLMDALLGPNHPSGSVPTPPGISHAEIRLGLPLRNDSEIVETLWTATDSSAQREIVVESVDGQRILSLEIPNHERLRGSVHLLLTPRTHVGMFPNAMIDEAIVLLPGLSTIAPAMAEQLRWRSHAVMLGEGGSAPADLLGVSGLTADATPRVVTELLDRFSEAAPVHRVAAASLVSKDSEPRLSRFTHTIAARKARLRALSERLSAEANIRQARRELLASLKTMLTKETARIEAAVADVAEDVLNLNDASFAEFKRGIGSLQESDLVIQPGRSKRRASLTPAAQARLGKLEQIAVEDAEIEIANTLRQAVKTLNTRLCSDAGEHPQFGVKLHAFSFHPPDPKPHTPAVLDIHLDFELPAKGFLSRLKEGRRTVFSVLMLFSIVAGTIGIRRDNIWVAFAMLSVFLVAVAATFWTWKADSEELVTKELGKHRDQLEARVDRMLRDRIRGVTNSAKVALSEFTSSVDQHLEILQRERDQTDRAESDQIRSITRQLEQQLRVSESAANSVRSSARTLREAIPPALDAIRARLAGALQQGSAK